VFESSWDHMRAGSFAVGSGLGQPPLLRLPTYTTCAQLPWQLLHNDIP